MNGDRKSGSRRDNILFLSDLCVVAECLKPLWMHERRVNAVHGLFPFLSSANSTVQIFRHPDPPIESLMPSPVSLNDHNAKRL